MLTKKEFNYLRGLIDTETQLLYRLNEGSENLTEPQLKENIQKLTASVNNHMSLLVKILKGVDNSEY